MLETRTNEFSATFVGVTKLNEQGTDIKVGKTVEHRTSNNNLYRAVKWRRNIKVGAGIRITEAEGYRTFEKRMGDKQHVQSLQQATAPIKRTSWQFWCTSWKIMFNFSVEPFHIYSSWSRLSQNSILFFTWGKLSILSVGPMFIHGKTEVLTGLHFICNSESPSGVGFLKSGDEIGLKYI
jgi:hypothetical protein